ncbi:MAG: quinone oxidoreductase [Kiritimatiellaeota bacterium]|nr:quinone oxidoreductase [Kiritimatiellota bacterium]
MKAIKVTSYGNARVLTMSTAEPMPKPGPGQVLVNIRAAGVNYVDIYQRKGIYKPGLPFIPGLEGAGVVEAVGAEVQGVRLGARVAYTGQIGSYSEYLAVDAEKLILLPKDLSFEEGAAFPLQGMTAHYLLYDYCKPGKKDAVLIHAAAGGVGLLLVQWAKHLGATVIGTVSTEEKARAAKEAGADHVIIYTQQDFAAETKALTNGRGAQLILDGVGKTTFNGNLEAAAKFGHVVIFGAASGPADPLSPNLLMPKSLTLSGGTLFNSAAARRDVVRRSQTVLAGIKKRWLKLRIDRVLPLAQAETAHRLLESRQTMGKLILKVAD